MLFLIGFLTFIGGIVYLGLTLNGVFANGAPGIIAIVIAALFVWFIGVDILKWKLRSRCGKCKTEYNYQDDVAYRQVGHRVKTLKLPQNAEHRHYRRTEEYFDLEYTCRCSKCGKVRKYKDKYLGRVTYYDGSIEDHDPALDSELRYDPNQRKADNRKGGIFCFFLGVLLIVGSVFLPGMIGSFSPTTNSEGDPHNYYGTWYGFSDSGYIMVVTLDEDRTYTLYTESYFTGRTEEAEGSFSYKDAEAAATVLQDPLYTDRSALLLLSDDRTQSYTLWFCEEGGEIYFDMNDGTKLTQDSANAENSLVDPKNYYGAYYGIDEENYLQYTLMLDEDGKYLFIRDDILTSTTLQGDYYYVTAKMVDAHTDRYLKYNDKNAVLLVSDNSFFIFWFVSDGNGIVLEDELSDTVLTEEKTSSLAEYMGDASLHIGTYRYSSTNYVQLSANGKATACINGETKTYSYFYASYGYLAAKGMALNGLGTIILYTPGSNTYMSFAVQSDGLSYSNVLFAK